MPFYLFEKQFQFDYLFQVHDSIDELFGAEKIMVEHYIELRSDILILIRELSSRALTLLDDIHTSLVQGEARDIKQKAKDLQVYLNDAHRQ